MTDWTSALEYTPENLKRIADLHVIAEALGIEWSENERAFCPFHDDRGTPDFHVFVGDDGVPRYSCFVCGTTLDVYDLVRRRSSRTFTEAVAFVRSSVESGAVWSPPEAGSSTAPGSSEFDAYASGKRHLRSDAYTIGSFFRDRRIEVPVEYVVEEFKVSTNEQGDVIVPHLDVEGRTVGVKIRHTPEWTKRNAKGSRFPVLYGTWRARGHHDVLLVEGESDAWTAAYALRSEDVDVYGLPTGAGTKPRDEWLREFEGRVVTLMLDSDDAGRNGARQWATMLEDSIVKIAFLPAGMDATEAGLEVVVEAYRNARKLEARPGGIERSETGYRKPSPRDPSVSVQISDWTADVLGLVANRDVQDVVVDVRLSNGETTQFVSEHFNSAAKMRRKMNAHFLTWTGTDADTQALFRLFRFESIYVPRLHGTTVAGWHDGGYVLPETSIGVSSWCYVPPVADVRLHERLDLRPGNWHRKTPLALVNLHASGIVRPILGWVGAAPMRATLPQFPVLALVGGSGWGKTTLVGEILGAFGFARSPMTITSTTPHAISALVASTNAIPVWLDEYRHGARTDTKDRLDQIIRDAWDGASSVKGGLQANLQALTFSPALAPIVVTGEDAFSETSHAERMIVLPIPKDGRDPEALRALRAFSTEGFGYSYLEWLSASYRDGTLPQAPIRSERMEQARAIAAWGWELLRLFTLETCSYDLGDYDESIVLAEHEEMRDSAPYVEALREMLGKTGPDGLDLVWQDGRDVCVRLQEFVREVRRTDLVFPGGSRAARKWYAQKYGIQECRMAGSGLRYTRLLGALVDM